MVGGSPQHAKLYKSAAALGRLRSTVLGEDALHPGTYRQN